MNKSFQGRNSNFVTMKVANKLQMPKIINMKHISPRARGVLFTLSRPKGLRVGPIVEKCAEFRNPFLKKISTELFS